MTRYLVTGAAGFIGSHLAEALLKNNHSVIGIDSFTDYYPRALKEGNLAHLTSDPQFLLVDQSLVDLPNLDELVDSCQGVFHLAAQAGVRGSWGASFSTYLRDNIEATQRVFEAAVRSKRRVVFASSSSVYGDASDYPTRESTPTRPVSPYGVTKLACETLAGAYAASRGLDFVALRYFTVYGPRQRPDMALTRILRALSDGSTFHLLGDGTQSRDVTYVRDAVSATVAGMERARAGSTFNVGGGTEISLGELIRRCESIMGQRLNIVRHETASGDAHRTNADTSRITQEIGWRAATSIDEGLHAHAAWVRACVEAKP
jgi:nucleoside-diphosphate-sugar epimerase